MISYPRRAPGGRTWFRGKWNIFLEKPVSAPTGNAGRRNYFYLILFSGDVENGIIFIFSEGSKSIKKENRGYRAFLRFCVFYVF